MRLAFVFALILPLGQDKNPPKAQELARNVEGLAKIATELRTRIPKAELDPAALTEKLGRDRARLFAFVRDRIGFEPYLGFMKGARGTLVSRRGNSADKALLLATLLSIAGERAELVKGTLEPKQQPKPAPFPDLGGGMPDEAAIRAMAASVGKPPEKLQARLAKQQSASESFRRALWTRYERDLLTLAEALTSAKVPPPAAVAPPEEHWWVRTREGDVDPTLGTIAGKETATHPLDKLPADSFHRITVRMKIRRGDEEISVLEVAVNSADAFGASYRIAILPVGGFDQVRNPKRPDLSKVFDLLAATTRFQPVFVSATKTITGHPFDLQGNRIPVRDGVVEKMKGTSDFFKDLSEKDDRKKKPELRAVWLDFRIDAPGRGSSVEIRRPILAEGVKGRQRVFDLFVSRDLLVLPGEISPLFVADLMLAFAAGAKPNRPEALRDRPPLHPALYVFALERQAALRKIAATGSMPRPTLVSYSRRFLDTKPVKVRSTFDILDNAMTGGASTEWKDHPGFFTGILDTALEHQGHKMPGEHWNASVLLEKTKPVLVREHVPDDLRVSPAARKEIESHLFGSVCVVIPGTPAAWYRIDLASGATLGYVEGGGGQDAVEYVTLASDFLKTLSEWNSYFELLRDILECVVATMTAEGNRDQAAAVCAMKIYSGQFVGTLVSAFFVPVPELPFLWAVQDHISDVIDRWVWGED